MSTSRGDRKFPRYDTHTKAKLRVLGSPDWTEVLLTNLSKGGACVESKVPFHQMTVVEIIVNSPNPDVRMHDFMARVVWSGGQRFGIQFITRL